MSDQKLEQLLPGWDAGKPSSIWRVHAELLLTEILQHNDHMWALEKPINIFGKKLWEVAERAAEINDPRLNILMIQLALYEVGDPRKVGGRAGTMAIQGQEARIENKDTIDQTRVDRLEEELKEAAKHRAEWYEKYNELKAALVKPGPMCRDCADNDGTCPFNGLPCDPHEEALEVVRRLKAASPEETLNKAIDAITELNDDICAHVQEGAEWNKELSKKMEAYNDAISALCELKKKGKS